MKIPYENYARMKLKAEIKRSYSGKKLHCLGTMCISHAQAFEVSPNLTRRPGQAERDNSGPVPSLQLLL